MASADAAPKDDDAYYDAAADDEYLRAARSGPYSSRIKELEQRIITARKTRQEHLDGYLKSSRARAAKASELVLAAEKALEEERDTPDLQQALADALTAEDQARERAQLEEDRQSTYECEIDYLQEKLHDCVMQHW